MITILTPTYNRASLLNKVYDSLTSQTDKDFEWLVIDDGSTDNTHEIIKKFEKEKKIDIQYYYKENGGKHTALNLGTNKARGELLLILDSDDYLDKNAIKVIKKYWKKYKDYKNICGITFLKKINNPLYKEKTFKECVSNMNNFKYNEGNLADMCEVMCTDILKKYPYPTFNNERFLSEVIVTGEIAKKYNLAYVPIVIYIAEYLDDGLSRNWFKLVVNNPKGARANSLLFMSKEYKLSIRIKNCLTYDVYSIIAKEKVIKDSKIKLLSLIFYLPSILIAEFLIIKYKNRSKT